MHYIRLKIGVFISLSIIFWAICLLYLSWYVPGVQTQLALDQMKSSDEAAHALRTTDLTTSWLQFVFYGCFSLCYWWSCIWYGIGKLIKLVYN